MLDEYHNYSSIQQALPAITQKLNNVATQNVKAVCQQGQDHEHESYIFVALNKALPPIFISSRCFDLATKGEQLSEEERHTLNNLNGMFPGFEFSEPVLNAVANFKPVREKLDEVRQNKESILSGRLDEIIRGARREQVRILRDIQNDISHRRKMLVEGDLEAMSAQQQSIIDRLKRGEQRIVHAFEQQMQVARNKMAETLNDLKRFSLDAKRVETQSGSRQEAYEVSRTVSASTWYKPWSWGSTRTVYSTEYRTVSYSYANVQDAVDKLELFVFETEKQLNTSVINAVNLKQLKEAIKGIIRDMFDFSEEGFDPQAVMMPLESALGRLTMPTIDLDLDRHIDTVRQQFTSTEVENDDIDRLRQEQGRIVGVLVNEMAAEVDTSVAEILGRLSVEKDQFIPELTQDLNAQVEQLSQDLQDSEQKMTEYNQVLELVSEDLEKLGA
ncbi:hypothetical protein [Endozoicomonas sp. 4G]|uniref:hypothetical protein n=1 Tax=Endozoicomonas sp. 4G TaxID=2872754 RepID=UPI002078CA42|nr:hypothetical protein [Endozoicomonas sp. 4G]